MRCLLDIPGRAATKRQSIRASPPERRRPPSQCGGHQVTGGPPNRDLIIIKERARIRRIGSHPTTPIRDYLISYAGTAQEAAVKLILEKVRVSELFDGFDLDAGLAAAGVQDGEMALALGNATTSIGRALYQHLKENSGLLRAAAFTNAVRLDVATVPVEPEPAAIQPVRSVIVPIRKGDATQLSMF